MGLDHAVVFPDRFSLPVTAILWFLKEKRMKALAITSLFLLSFSTLFHVPKEDINQEVTVNGLTYLYGEINREGLSSKNYQTWFKTKYDAYQPSSSQLAMCNQQSLDGVTVKLLMATWCGDSKRNVPAFYKIMDQLGFDEKNLQAYALDRRKHGPNGEQIKYGVTRVPTIIFYRDDVEIGRFVERPRPGQKLEDIIVSILNQP